MKRTIVLLAALFFFFACENEEPDREAIKPAKEDNNEAIVEKANLKKGMNILDAWIRPAAKGGNTGLFFRMVNNATMDDTLLSASSNVAKKVEVHETYKENDMMGMREVDYIPIEAGGMFYFKPMAHHVMLIQLNENMKAGQSAEVTLVFKRAGKVVVTAPVEDKMPVMKPGKEKIKKNEE